MLIQIPVAAVECSKIVTARFFHVKLIMLPRSWLALFVFAMVFRQAAFLILLLIVQLLILQINRFDKKKNFIDVKLLLKNDSYQVFGAVEGF